MTVMLMKLIVITVNNLYF